MNIQKQLIISFFSLSLLTACDQENEKMIYESDTDNYVSFRTDKLNKELEKTENLLIIPVYRENKQGVADVHVDLFFQQTPDGGEIPGRDFISLENNVAVFADGENRTEVKLKIDLTKLDYLTKAKTNIQLQAGRSTSVSAFAKSSLILSLSRKPTWMQFKEQGVYTSQFLGTTKNVTIQKAEEAPFYIIKDCYVKNGDIRVDLDKDGNATIEQQKAFRHADYGIVYATGTGVLDKAKNKVVMQLKFLVEQDGQWGVLSGVAFEETFTIPSE